MLEHAHARGALAAGFLALAVAGCGSSDKSDTSGGGGAASTPAATQPANSAPPQKLKLEADDDGGLYFKPKALKAKAGAVSLVMENPKSTGLQHGIALKGNGVDQDGPVVSPGKTATVTVTLKPGKYTFYCNFDAHAKKGMKGTLTVR
jgi:uncharacterized cupredoxin-like copper-binding protein